MQQLLYMVHSINSIGNKLSIFLFRLLNLSQCHTDTSEIFYTCYKIVDWEI